MARLLIALILALVLSSCENTNPNPTAGDDNNPTTGGNTPSPPTIATLKLLGLSVLINGKEATFADLATLKVGDEITLKGDLSRANPTDRLKLTLFRNCQYAVTLKDWSTDAQVDLSHTIIVDDVTDCTSINFWVRTTNSANPWPEPGDLQEAFLVRTN